MVRMYVHRSMCSDVCTRMRVSIYTHTCISIKLRRSMILSYLVPFSSTQLVQLNLIPGILEESCIYVGRQSRVPPYLLGRGNDLRFSRGGIRGASNVGASSLCTWRRGRKSAAVGRVEVPGPGYLPGAPAARDSWALK